MKDKPAIIQIEEFKKELEDNVNELINKYKIPMYFVNIIIEKLHSTIANLASQEYTQTVLEYNKKEEKDVKDKE